MFLVHKRLVRSCKRYESYHLANNGYSRDKKIHSESGYYRKHNSDEALLSVFKYCIKRLNAADNIISNLSSDTFKNNRNLWKLNLNGNQIQEFPNGFFENIPDLQVRHSYKDPATVMWVPP